MKKMFWSPSVNWKVTEGKLEIESYIYDKEFSELFPKFYFLTQEGIELNKLYPLTVSSSQQPNY